MGIKQLYNDNLRRLPNEYGDVSVMPTFKIIDLLVSEKTILSVSQYADHISHAARTVSSFFC